jgi:hypothetical protein
VRIALGDPDFYHALWIRDALDLDVAASPIVPGRLRARPPLRRDLIGPRSAELGSGWIAWWSDLAENSPFWDVAPKYRPPSFDDRAEWPGLQSLTGQLWEEASVWHNRYKRAIIDDYIGAGGRQKGSGPAAREAAARLGRPLGDLRLELIVLPVEGDFPLEVNSRRYIVPDGVYEDPSWHTLLADMFVRAS